MKKVLVLAGGYDQIDLILELKKFNFYIILIDYYENPPAKRFADIHIKESTLDYVAVKEIALRENVVAIFTASTDQALLNAALVSEELNLYFYLTYQQALEVTNKKYMKTKMIENLIPTSKYIIVNSFEELEEINLSLPFVIKPVDSNSSKGVSKIDSLNNFKSTYDNTVAQSRSKTIIIEEFLEGIEVSVDVFIDNYTPSILLLTETNKAEINVEEFTIIQSKFPASITKDQENKILDIIKQIAIVFNIKNGPMLVQMIVNSNGIYVIEFSARMGGGSKHKLIQHLTGINIMKEFVNFALNKETFLNGSIKYNFASLNYCYGTKGRFDTLVNFEELKKKGVILDYYVYKPKGSIIHQSKYSSDRIIGYLLVDDSNESLIEKNRFVQQKIKIMDGNIDILNRELLPHNEVLK